MPGVQAGLKPGAVQPGAGLCPPRRCCRCHRRAGSASSGPRLLPVSGAGCPPSQAPPGRAGTQPRRDAHRAQGGLSPWLAVSRPPARPACPAAPGPGAGKMTAAPRWSRAGVRGSSRTSSAACCAVCWRPAAWPATASPESPAPAAGSSPRWGSGPGSTASSAPSGQRARLDPCPGVAPRLCPDADASAVSRQPGRPPSRCLAGTPALPRARPGPAAAAGSRIVHLLRRLRRPWPGPGACPPARRRPEGRAARLHGDREAVHRGRVRCTVVFIQYPRSRNRVQGHGAEDSGSVH